MVTIKGKDWEVRRDFIGQYEAHKAGTQARKLLEAAPDYAEEFAPDDSSWRETELTVIKVPLEAMPTSDMKAYAGLVGVAFNVNKAAQRLAGGDVSNEVFLNFYEPGGSSGEHRDGHTDATVAVGLLGVGEARMWDEENECWQRPINLYPGDALRLNSEGYVTPEERPLHVVQCASDVPRIAIANA